VFYQIFMFAAIVLGSIQIYLLIKSLIFYKILYPHIYQPKFANPEHYPSVHLLIPSKGLSENLEKIARAFATQEYPGHHRLSFIVESTSDPGYPLLQRLAKQYERTRLIVAGYAQTCSQKNHNLLAGMADDHTSDVFAFADADVLVGPQWLRQIVSPLSMGKQWISTGLCSATITSTSLPHLIEAALTTYQSKMIMSVTSIWGGSYSIWRETFDALNIREHWRNIAVDDVALYAKVQTHNLRNLLRPARRIRVMPVPDLDLQTFTRISSIAGLIQWFTRQVLYIKFYRRPIWHLAVWANFCNGVLAFFAPIFLLVPFYPELFQVGIIGFYYGLFLVVVNASLPLIRKQTECTFLQWLKIWLFGDLVANISLQATLLTNQLVWSKIRYHVAPDGRVEKVIHPTLLPHTLPNNAPNNPDVITIIN
jgi:hypothetical protein